MHQAFDLELPGTAPLRLGIKPTLMGIVNVTPDSFSDGSDFVSPNKAVAHAQLMAEQGAAIIDVGGESTRPGADEVGPQAELDRVMPVLDRLAELGFARPISIDTYKALVADQAVQAGARLINDVYGLQRQPEIADVAALHGVPVVVMHWDKARNQAKDIISEICRYFEASLAIADKAGLARDRVILDPGFGFAKSLVENYELLRRLDELHAFGCPLLVGMSRKSMIGRVLDAPVEGRGAGTVATSVLAYAAGAHIFRVHEVGPNADALRVARATLYGPE